VALRVSGFSTTRFTDCAKRHSKYAVR